MLRVAVRLPTAAGRIGDYLADVTALEAARRGLDLARRQNCGIYRTLDLSGGR